MMIAMLYYAGIRLDEMHRVKIKHIDFGKKTLLIPMSKNGESRVIPISESFFDEIVQYYSSLIKFENNKSEYFLISYGRSHRFKKMSYGASRACIKRVLSQSGYSQLSPYCFRHLFATKLWRGGANESDISNLMGHKNVRSMFDYVVPKHQSRASAVELL